MDFTATTAFYHHQFLPYTDIAVRLGNASFLYGLGVFTGMRVHKNPKTKALFLFRPQDHYRRLTESARICHLAQFEKEYTEEDFIELLRTLIQKNAITDDVYIRVTIFPEEESIGARYGYKDVLSAFLYPMGDYVPTTGMRCMISSWRRISDTAIPARAKVIGAYVNTALAKTDALNAGYDEAILLDEHGHAVEGSAENLFIVRHGVLSTPPVTDNILEGITRNTIILLAREHGITVEERSIDKTELYIADEIILTGTGAKVSPVTTIDHRPVGTGKVGPIATALQHVYDQTVRGLNPSHPDWVIEL